MRPGAGTRQGGVRAREPRDRGPRRAAPDDHQAPDRPAAAVRVWRSQRFLAQAWGSNSLVCGLSTCRWQETVAFDSVASASGVLRVDVMQEERVRCPTGRTCGRRRSLTNFCCVRSDRRRLVGRRADDAAYGALRPARDGQVAGTGSRAGQHPERRHPHGLPLPAITGETANSDVKRPCVTANQTRVVL